MIVFPSARKRVESWKMPSLVLGQSQKLVQTVVAVQRMKALLVMSQQPLMVAVRAVERGAAVSILRWAWAPTDLPAVVEAAVGLTNLFLILCEMRQLWCPAVDLVGTQLAPAVVLRLMVDKHIGRWVSEQPTGAVSELQALYLWCQLRQQLGLFFRHFFCAPLPPCAALLPLGAAAVHS